MKQLSRKDLNDKVDVQVRRDGRKRDVDVTLGDSADFFNHRPAAHNERDAQREGRDRNSDNTQDRDGNDHN